MTPIRPARLMKNVDLVSIPTGSPSKGARPAPSRSLAGRALIFWDPQRPGEKRDAIDTDPDSMTDDNQMADHGPVRAVIEIP